MTDEAAQAGSANNESNASRSNASTSARTQRNVASNSHVNIAAYPAYMKILYATQRAYPNAGLAKLHHRCKIPASAVLKIFGVS
jgi:hypothetical protein